MRRSMFVVVFLAACSDASEGDYALVEDRLDGLDADLTAATDQITALQTDLTEASDQITALEDQITALQDQVDALQADNDVWLTYSDTWTIGSGGDYATLQEAWSAASGKRLGAGVLLTLQLLDGTHAVPTSLVLDHPDGERIKIQGSSPASVTVNAPGGLYLRHGHRFGGITGITLDGGSALFASVGLWVDQGASTELWDTVIQNYDAGIRANFGALVEVHALEVRDSHEGINATSGAIVVSAGLVTTANYNGVVLETGAVFSGPVDVPGNELVGAVVRRGSLLSTNGIDATGNQFGAWVSEGSAFDTWGGTFGDHATGTAVLVTGGSYAAVMSAAVDSCQIGFDASGNSVIERDVTLTSVTTPVTTSAGAIVVP